MITDKFAPKEGDVLDSQMSRGKVTTNDDLNSQTSTCHGLKENPEKTKRKTSNLVSEPATDNAKNDERTVKDSETRHVNTYKIRFKHSGYDKCGEDLTLGPQQGDVSKGGTGDLNHQENNAKKSTDSKLEAPEGGVEETSKNYQNLQKEEKTECTKQEISFLDMEKDHLLGSSSWSTAATTNLPLLPEMHGNVKTKTSNGKAIRGLNGSKSSNWVFVGSNGKRHLRRPTPLPNDTLPLPVSKAPSLPLSKSLPPITNKSSTDRLDSGFSLPPIENDMLTKVNKWGLKTNRVTLSALLEVDHKKACLRDIETLEFGKELGLLFKTRIEPVKDEYKERTDNDAKLNEWKQVEDSSENQMSCVKDQYSLEEHCPSTPVVLITPVPPANKENKECPPTKKEKTEHHNTTYNRECGKKLRKSKDQCRPNAENQARKKATPQGNAVCKAGRKAADQSNTVCENNKKSKVKKHSFLRKSRSTLPDDLPDEKLPMLPDKLQYVLDDNMLKMSPDRKFIGVANSETFVDGFDLLKDETLSSPTLFDDRNNRNVSLSSNNVIDDKDKKVCSDYKSNKRSDSTIRERLAVDMDFECQNDEFYTFEDDKTLQRAVVLRNRAFHPLATPVPPPTPSPDQEDINCSYVFDHQNPLEWQGEGEEFDEYSESSRGISFMDQLQPALFDIECLIDKKVECLNTNFSGERLDCDRDAKLSKSVRFADLPPKRKHDLSKSKSDPTTDLPPKRKHELSRSKSDPTTESSKATAQSSAEWNKCFLVAVGENRTIKKEIRKQQHPRNCPQQDLNYDDDDAEDDLGPELIEREMKRYIHWLRHDRATEQHRWFSSSVSHRSFPMSTHQVPSQQPPVSYGVNTQLSSSSISAKVAKAIGIYSVLPKPEIEVPSNASRPVRFPKVPVLPPIAGGSNEVLISKTFTGEVKGLPIAGQYTRNSRRCSTEHNRRRGAPE